LTGGALLSTLLEGEERFGVRWDYPGAVGRIFVDVNADAGVRGAMTHSVIAHEVETEQDVYGDDGTLSIVKSNAVRQLSAGTTKAAYADVIGDLALFFCVSDQVETAMRVLIRLSPDPEKPVQLCHGVMMQAMPGCDLEEFACLADGLLKPEINAFLDHEQVADNTIERILQVLMEDDYDGSKLQLYSCHPPKYHCGCSREKTFGALRTIPQSEIREMIEAGENATVTCEFCRTRQVFEPVDLQKLLPADSES
jgi:molecular chaperone Hsp33